MQVMLLVASLLEVTVSAAALDAGKRDNVSPTEVWTAAEVAESGAHDFAGFLAAEANLGVRTLNANPFESHIALRGYGENSHTRVKVNLDGEALDRVDLEYPDLTQVPLANVTRLEIIRGPSPVLYGDGAVAGVINVSTDGGDSSNRTHAALAVGSDGTASLNFGRRGGLPEEGLRYSADYDFRRSDGWRERSGYRLHNFRAALSEDFADGSTLGLTARYANGYYEMPGALPLSECDARRRDAAYANDWCREWSYGGSLTAKVRLGLEDRLDLAADFSLRHRSAHWGDYGYRNDYDLFGFMLRPRYVNEALLWGCEQKLIVGSDFGYDLDDVHDRSGFGSPRSRFERLRLAFFGWEEFRLTKSFALVGGSRLEGVRNRWRHAACVTRPRGHEWDGDFELGARWLVADDFKVFVKGTRFHHYPRCDELNYTRDGEFLGSEHGWSLDLGFDWRFLEECELDFALFATRTEDEIFYDPYAQDSSGGWNCNSPAPTRRLGAETALKWRREGVAEASVRYAFVDARFLTGEYAGSEVPLDPAHRLGVAVGVWLGPEFRIRGGMRWVASQQLAGDYRNEHGGFDGHIVFDAGFSYYPEWCEGLKFDFSCDNLFDCAYVDYAVWSDYGGAAGYPTAGRTFLASIGWEW